jgi:hypothetical protein
LRDQGAKLGLLERLQLLGAGPLSTAPERNRRYSTVQVLVAVATPV